MTQPNWQTFINVCQEVLGYSPTRGLDICSISIDKPSAYLGCLDLENNPLENFRHGYRALMHFFASFIIKGDIKLVNQLYEFTSLNYMIRKREGSDIYLIIATANMSDWKATILRCCCLDIPTEIRAMMNRCHIHFREEGFAQIWDGYISQNVGDGTYTLTR